MWAKGSPGSNDKPTGGYGIPGLDDYSVRKVINAIAPCMPRNYLVMEVKSNLIADERKECLKKFNYPCYKKVAHVVMGKPNAEFKEMVHSKILKEKQTKADNTWKAEAKKREIEKKRREAEKKRKAEIEAKKKAKEEAEKKAKEGDEKKDEPAEEKKEEEAPMEEDEKEEEPPKAELTEEEKAINFLPKKVPDLAPSVLSTSYAKFTTPQAEEGFDDIRYEWEKAGKADAYLRDWVMNKKLTTKIDTIRPGQFFKDKLAQFEKESKTWQEKQKTAKKPVRKVADEEEAEIDIYGVADINDAGEGVPLFSQFTYEDWELVKTRFELALLISAFKKDSGDSDRVGIPLDHLNFYFPKYYSRSINLKTYGATEIAEVFALIKDTVAVKDSVLVSQLSDEIDALDIFVKLTEEQRRERQRRIDAGDETARLKFTPPPKPAPKPAPKIEAKPAEKKPEPKAAPKKAVEAPKVVQPKAAPAPSSAKGKGKGKK